MFRMSETPQKPHETAPGTFGGAAARWSSPARSTPRQLPDAVDPDGPLAGIRVVDLTTAWSGPMATRLLAALGASVVKIEGPSRIDDWRGPVAGGHRARYPDGVPGDRPFDRCYQFNTQNHDKRSLVVDLKTEAGLALVRRLAVRADVLIANFSAGTLDRMGLGFQSMAALNEGLIVVEMPAYGSGGPLSEHVALGPSMELMAGMASSIGYGDGRPVTTGPAYLDPLGGFNSAAAVLTAIAAREITGRGQHVELAQREAAMHWIGEEIVWAAAHGSDRPPDGNRVEGVVPHDAFHAAGSDEWIAIAAPDEKAFAALAAVIGKPNSGRGSALPHREFTGREPGGAFGRNRSLDQRPRQARSCSAAPRGRRLRRAGPECERPEWQRLSEASRSRPAHDPCARRHARLSRAPLAYDRI